MVGLSYNPAPDIPQFLYGSDNSMGPFDWMVVALSGLLSAQLFCTFQAWRTGAKNWSGIAVGACNIGMISLFICALVINWAFYNPLSPLAQSINSLPKHPLIFSDFHFAEPMETRPRAPGWEQLDTWTYCHAGAGIIERLEIIKPSHPLDHQRANFAACNADHLEHFRDATLRARQNYDLDWNLIAIDAPQNWPIVRERREAAGVNAQYLDDDIWLYLESLRHDPDTSGLPSCDGRVAKPFPQPNFADYENEPRPRADPPT